MKELYISENIVKLRREHGITQKQLADFIGVTKASVSKWETGQSVPDVLLLPRLATFFDVTIDELMGYEPQLSKEQIRKLYHDFCTAFAEGSFGEAYHETKKYVRKYYSCYPFLNQICVLWLNHVEIAGSPQVQQEVLRDIKELCMHIEAHCPDRSISKYVVVIGAIVDMQLGNAKEAVEALETIADPFQMANQCDGTMIQAYMMAQEQEKAERFTQLSMYLHLTGLVSSGTMFLGIHSDNLELCEETMRRLSMVCDAYDVAHLNANTSAVLKYQMATVYCMHGRIEQAVMLLKEYVANVQFLLSGDVVYKHADEYFTQIEDWYQKMDLAIDIPRDKRIILNNCIMSLKHPALQGLWGMEEYTGLLGQLQEIGVELEKEGT